MMDNTPQKYERYEITTCHYLSMTPAKMIDKDSEGNRIVKARVLASSGNSTTILTISGKPKSSEFQ